MKCHFVIILVWLTGAQGSDTTGHEIKQPVNYGDSGYPLVEVTGGVGFIWLFQGNITFSPAKFIYIQPRFSYVGIAQEAGYTVGFQKRYQENSIFRLGVGYSWGSSATVNLGGGEGENWSSYYFRVGLLIRKSSDFIYNPNINITKTDTDLLFSFNFTVGFAWFR